MRDHVAFGEALTDLRVVAEKLKASVSFPVLLRRWRVFALNIGLCETTVLQMDTDLDRNKLELQDVIRKILVIWKAENGGNATIRVLHEALLKTGVRDVAETLERQTLLKSQEHISIDVEETCWEDFQTHPRRNRFGCQCTARCLIL